MSEERGLLLRGVERFGGGGGSLVPSILCRKGTDSVCLPYHF